MAIALQPALKEKGLRPTIHSQAISIVYPKVESSGTSIPRSSDDFTISGSFIYRRRLACATDPPPMASSTWVAVTWASSLIQQRLPFTPR
jgi:hypothetical protein